MYTTIKCKICNAEEKITVDPAAYAAWCAGASIQDVMPDMHVLKRTALVKRLCLNCASKIFNYPKPGEDWGEQVADCPSCHCSIWSRDVTGDGVYRCPNCGYAEGLVD